MKVQALYYILQDRLTGHWRVIATPSTMKEAFHWCGLYQSRHSGLKMGDCRILVGIEHLGRSKGHMARCSTFEGGKT
jgi:hypothetical protein